MTTESLTGRLHETLELFVNDGSPMTTTEVANSLDVGRRSTYERLETLVEHGRLQTKKVGANARVWWRPPKKHGDQNSLRQVEEQLAQEQALNEQLFDMAPIGLSVFGPDREVVRANEKMVDAFGSTIEDQATVLDGDLKLLDEEGRPLAIEDHPVEQAFETGDRVFDRELKVQRPGEPPHWVSVNAAPFPDKTGDTRVIATTTDITQRKEQAKQLERKREDLERELDEIFTRIDDAFYALDENLRVVYVNDRAEELLGHTESDLLGRTVWEVLSVDDDPLQEEFKKTLDDQTPKSFELYSNTLDIWEIVRVYPSESGLSVYFTDITERKKRERKLKRFEKAVESSGHAIYMTDADGVITYVNPQFEAITGYDESEAVGKSPAILQSGHHDEAYFRELRETITAGNIWDEEIVNRRADGSLYHAQQTIAPVTDEDGEIDRFVAIQSDITDRKEREQALRDRIHQQEMVADMGQRALHENDLDRLLADGVELVAETLDSDYCKVLDLDENGEELLLRQGVGWDDGVVGSTTISAVGDDSQAAYTLESEGPVIVSDLEAETRFSGPELLTDHDIQSGISTTIGPNDDPWGILAIHDSDPKEFFVQDVTFAQGIANIFANAIHRHEYEQELIHQRERLAALNSLSEVVQDITAAVIGQPTREEIEETVCERLAETDSYLFAWTGEVDPGTQTVALRTEAGVEGYLDGITISVNSDDARSEGPTGRALKTGETQVTQDIHVDSRHDPWGEYIEEYGFRSSAAIPITHEGAIYGVINVYAERPYAFEGQERTVISRLGKIVGHAIAAAERKQTLLSDELVELDFRIQDVYADVDSTMEVDGTITLDHMVPTDDGEFLVYGTATRDAFETMDGLLELLPHWESISVISENDLIRFELRMIDPPVLSVVAAHGGYIDEAVIEDGDYRMSIRLASGVDVRNIVDAVEAAYPEAELLRRRQISQPQDQSHQLQRQLVADLTDRQRSAVEAAYHAGFFKWPRETTGEQIAESLGIAAPTFHQHLRKAQQKTFDALLSDRMPNVTA